ncbi:MAG: MarR family transcriptional regulator [Clostridiales bacterium]|nr:MarR family transcriptional regulator [Clostridiales bacterium]
MKELCEVPAHREPKTPEERLNRALRRCGHYLYHHSAGPRQATVLRLLQENGSMSQRDIQEALHIQPGSVSELLSKLENKGFLLRQRDAEDKRKVNIVLTPRGQAQELRPMEETLSQRYAVLSEAEQALVTDCLERLLASWDEGGCGT